MTPNNAETAETADEMTIPASQVFKVLAKIHEDVKELGELLAQVVEANPSLADSADKPLYRASETFHRLHLKVDAAMLAATDPRAQSV